MVSTYFLIALHPLLASLSGPSRRVGGATKLDGQSSTLEVAIVLLVRTDCVHNLFYVNVSYKLIIDYDKFTDKLLVLSVRYKNICKI